MRLLRHFSANDEQLDLFPFKRELSMEAYLVENEGVLCLDDDNFSDVEIIEEELTLKQGRKSKDTDGRIDILVTYSQEYIGVIELKLGQLEEKHVKQLEDYLLEKDQILQQYPDILSDEPSPEKWIGVLVGTSINPDLANKISNGYVINSEIPIAALTIQRFRSAKGNVYVTTDTYFKKTASTKDTSQYLFGGKKLGKGRLVLEIIKHHIEKSPNVSFSELEKQFPKTCQGSIGVFSDHKEAEDIHLRTNRKRHFIKPDELVTLSDTTIAVCNQWGSRNINKFIKIGNELGYNIQSSGS